RRLMVGDVRQRGPEREPMPECYMTYGQHAFNGTTLSVVVRTVGDPNALAETLRRLARERSPDVPMTFTTMDAPCFQRMLRRPDFARCCLRSSRPWPYVLPWLASMG